MASPTRSRVHFDMPLDARSYGDNLLSCQSGAVIALALSVSGPLRVRDVQRLCGVSRQRVHQIMAELQAIWPALQRRVVTRSDIHGGVEIEWYVEVEVSPEG